MSKQPHRESEPFDTYLLKRRGRQATELPQTGPAETAAIGLVPRPGSEKRKATSNPRPVISDPQAPAMPVSAKRRASTIEGQKTQTQGSGAIVPMPSNTALLQVTDPEEIAFRKELLEVPDGHKLIHLLRHATAWSKYILVIVRC